MHSLWQLIVSVKLALSVKNTLEKLWSTHILRLLTIICLHFVNLNSFRCQYQNWIIYKSILLQYRIVVMPYSFEPKLPRTIHNKGNQRITIQWWLLLNFNSILDILNRFFTSQQSFFGYQLFLLVYYISVIHRMYYFVDLYTFKYVDRILLSTFLIFQIVDVSFMHRFYYSHRFSNHSLYNYHQLEWTNCSLYSYHFRVL